MVINCFTSSNYENNHSTICLDKESRNYSFIKTGIISIWAFVVMLNDNVSVTF